MARIAVVTACDDRYCVAACALLRSLGANGGLPPHTPVIVMTDSLSLESDRALRSAAERAGLRLEVRSAEDAHAVVVPDTAYSGAAYLRLQIADVCADFDRVLYLDADTLAVGSVAPLLRASLGRRSVGAVVDPFVRTVGAAPGSWSHAAASIPRDAPYFNSGVLLIDIARWSAGDVRRRAEAFLRDFRDRVRFPDQDALNAVLYGAWRRLAHRWNACPACIVDRHLTNGVAADDGWSTVLTFVRRVERSARIVHFMGPYKPWASDFPDGDLRARYATYCSSK